MRQFILGVRKQTMECLLAMEATRKDTAAVASDDAGVPTLILGRWW